METFFIWTVFCQLQHLYIFFNFLDKEIPQIPVKNSTSLYKIMEWPNLSKHHYCTKAKTLGFEIHCPSPNNPTPTPSMPYPLFFFLFFFQKGREEGKTLSQIQIHDPYHTQKSMIGSLVSKHLMNFQLCVNIITKTDLPSVVPHLPKKKQWGTPFSSNHSMKYTRPD